jgi:hypothetical protein
VTDLEDGTHPIYTYGKDQEEVLRKLAQQNANAQIAIMNRKAAPATSTAPPLPSLPRRITPDQVMQATSDLEDPEKSGQAIAVLLEAHTGLNPEQMVLENFQRVAESWENERTDFYSHPANRRLLAAEALKLAGGSLGHITGEYLTRALHNLRLQGVLVENGEPPAPNTFPAETQVQRDGQQRSTRFATGSRSTGFQRQAAPTRTLKYSEVEIRTMPLAKSRDLINRNDKDFAEACEYYFGSAQASA